MVLEEGVIEVKNYDVLGLVLPSLLPLQEGRADGLDLDILLLGDAEHALLGEVVAHLLHEALEVVVVVGYPHLVCLGSLTAAPVQFALMLAEVAIVALVGSLLKTWLCST